MSVVTSSNPPKDNVFPFQCLILAATNYNTWSIKMEAITDAHGLWEDIEPATGVLVDKKKNKQARAFILEEILSQAAKKKTAKEVWYSLKSRYVGAKRVQKARLWILKSEFQALHMKDEETIDEYARKISGMISKYNSVGATLEDEELVRKLFDTVPKKFINLVASIEQSLDVDSMPFEEAIGHHKAYEDRLNLKKGSVMNENKLPFTKAENSSNQKATNKMNTAGGRGRGWNNGRGGRNGSRGRGSTRGRGGRWGGGFHQETSATN
ncbi:uncharacterized protein LOC110943223 [Helianthus annuus]|uniref:uncharacterized protein LOC110943223 n=1 Tax=Helianthus annuus TaxID=4232 RepID=UPI000B900948|nr:uncharacterized protein LOC110943223 [Helianthus annuus]